VVKVTWAYGVTTVPLRRDNLLVRTLASLRAAGFDRPRLFVDGDNDPQSWQREFGLEVTCRMPALRVHGNWVLSLYELFVRDPTAERFALFQDDLVTCCNLRSYLERCTYPDGPVNPKQRPGYWNLYSSPANQDLAPAVGQTSRRMIGWYPSNQFGRGAVALVFSREGVLTLLSGRHLVERPMDSGRGWRAVDGGIVDTMRKAGWIEYVHHPSLVLHTGRTSTFDRRRNATGPDSQCRPYIWPEDYERTTFRGEDFDALKLLSEARDN